MHYAKTLSKDPRMKMLLKQFGALQLQRRENICLRLCESIMSQQLSTKVADVIYARFLALFNGREPTPKEILSVPQEKLRAAGMSSAKANYVLNVARFAAEKGMDYEVLSKMNDDEVIAYLTEIKGVGRWTVEMLLMFTLGREDVSPLDDLGASQAMVQLYGLRTKDRKKLRRKMIQIAEAWAPYRTYAYLYLWRWKDSAKK